MSLDDMAKAVGRLATTAEAALDAQLRRSASALEWTMHLNYEGQSESRKFLDQPSAHPDNPEPWQEFPAEELRSLFIAIRNTGQTTLGDVKVKFSGGLDLLEDSSGKTRSIGKLGPGTLVRLGFYGHRYPSSIDEADEQLTTSRDGYVDWVEFTDLGRRWRLDNLGVLTPADGKS